MVVATFETGWSLFYAIAMQRKQARENVAKGEARIVKEVREAAKAGQLKIQLERLR